MSNYCVILSHDMFSGFRINIPVEEAKNLSISEQNELIIRKSKEKLNNFFIKEHLFVMCDNYVSTLRVHLHRKLVENEVNYACDHCHQQIN